MSSDSFSSGWMRYSALQRAGAVAAHTKTAFFEYCLYVKLATTPFIVIMFLLHFSDAMGSRGLGRFRLSGLLNRSSGHALSATKWKQKVKTLLLPPLPLLSFCLPTYFAGKRHLCIFRVCTGTGISLNTETKARPTLCSVFIYRYMLRVALSFILSSSFLPLLYLIVFLLSLLPYVSFFAFSLFIFSLFLSLLSVFFRLLTFYSS